MQSKLFTQFLTLVLALGSIPMLAQTPFYTEDFGDEANATANWTSGGENDGSETWTWSNDPGWSGSNYPNFAAPTAENGFFYFNSDGNGFNQHAVTLTSPVIDCSNQNQVFLEMYTQYIYYFYDGILFDEPNVELGVSVNGGDFVYRGILTEVGAIDLFESAQRVVLELPEAINQSQVQIQIRWTGIFEYFLNIDDIALYNTEPFLTNDLAIQGVRIPPSFATPLSQVDSVFFLGMANNLGADPQTNVRMRVSVLTEDGNLEFQDSTESTNMLAAGAMDTLAVEEGYLPTEVGDYFAIQTVLGDETDDFPSNNRDIFNFRVTNRIFANDNGQQNWPPLLPAEVNGDFWDAGNLFYVKNGEGYEVDSIYFSFFSQEESVEGQNATLLLYKIEEDDDPSFTNADLANVGFANYTFTADDESGSLVAAPIFREDGFTPGVPLEDSTEYVAMVSVPADMGIFYTYRDIIYDLASVIRNGDDLSRFSAELAMIIRMSVREAQPDAVKEPELDDARINAFPNPAKDFYRIDLDLENTSAVQLQLMSISGQILQQREYTALQRDRIDLDVSKLAAGAYLLKVRTEEGVKTLKFTKQ